MPPKSTAQTPTADVKSATDASADQALGADAAAVDQDAVTLQAEEVPIRGRALVDIPDHNLKCGEFGALPYPVAQALFEAGAFDPRAAESQG